MFRPRRSGPGSARQRSPGSRSPIEGAGDCLAACNHLKAAETLSRRQFIRLGLGAVAFNGALASPATALWKRAAETWRSGRHLAGPPTRQFAWNSTLARDVFGNPIPPRHDRLLFFDVRRPPTAASARELEAAFRTLERAFPWGPDGVLFTVSWGPRYFSRVLGMRSPVPRPTALSTFENQPGLR